MKLRPRLALAILAACLGAFALSSPAAWAWTPSALSSVSQREDRFFAYDFESASAVGTNCDWPVTIVFWGNASVDDVKTWLSSKLPFAGNAMYARVCERFVKRHPYRWVSDRGAKSNPLATEALHMRLYADGDGSLTNSVWGNYVIATTHYDRNELTANPSYGWSEDAAAAIEVFCVAAFGADAVVADVLPLWNAEPQRTEQRARAGGGTESHIWQCDGLATMVEMP